MNSKLHIPRITKRRNPLWLTNFAKRIGEFRRLRRSGLGFRSSFRCAMYCRLK